MRVTDAKLAIMKIYVLTKSLRNMVGTGCMVALCLLTNASVAQPTAELRVAVIGGLEMSGVWTRIEAAAGAELDLQILTVMAAPKERVVPAFMQGEVDFLLIHGGDETFALESLGYSDAARTWGYNEFVIVGPPADPAGVAESASGVAALRKIQAGGQPLITFRDAGSHQVLRRLMDNAGLVPAQFNLLHDSALQAQQILNQAAQQNAYVIVGHLPVAFERMPTYGMQVLLQGDPAMRRAYVIVTPGPLHPASAAARTNAKRLAAYLVSDAGQAMLGETNLDDNTPWIYPRSAASGLLDMRPRQGGQPGQGFRATQ